MITIEKAFEIFRTYLGDAFAVASAYDIRDAFVLDYCLKDYPGEIADVPNLYAINKHTGSIEPFLLTNRDNFKRLRTAVEIPREKWPV